MGARQAASVGGLFRLIGVVRRSDTSAPSRWRHPRGHRCPIGDDPAVLLRNYEKRKRTKAADASLSNAIGALGAGFLGPEGAWVHVGSCCPPVLDLPAAKCLMSRQRKGGRVV